MSLPTYPPTLPPRFLVSGYSQQQQDNVLRFTPERGPEVTKLLFTRALIQASGYLPLTNSQLPILENFFRITLNYGVLSFNWVRPDFGTATVCRFKQPFVYTPIAGGQRWNAATVLEFS